MPHGAPAVKKSVTIDPDVLDSLSPERRANLSATVNESLRWIAARDAQLSLVEALEAEYGPVTEQEMRPFLDIATRAIAERDLMRSRLERDTSRADG
jgi:hypothetical protein